MVLNLLQQEGIDGRVEGEHLQSGVGELLAINVVRVVVSDADYERARSVIQGWESLQADSADISEAERKPSRAAFGFLLGLVVGIGGMYWAYTTPVTREGIDYTGDGSLDEVWIYRGNRVSHTEIDRNRDGRVDFIFKFDRKGLIQRAKLDDNFDGHFETVIHYRDGNQYLTEADTGGLGFVSYREHWRHGVLEMIELLDPVTRAVRKRMHYTQNKLTFSEFDSTGDGLFDTCYRYDYFEEIDERSAC